MSSRQRYVCGLSVLKILEIRSSEDIHAKVINFAIFRMMGTSLL